LTREVIRETRNVCLEDAEFAALMLLPSMEPEFLPLVTLDKVWNALIEIYLYNIRPIAHEATNLDSF
jgi:hypothetical protein